MYTVLNDNCLLVRFKPDPSVSGMRGIECTDV